MLYSFVAADPSETIGKTVRRGKCVSITNQVATRMGGHEDDSVQAIFTILPVEVTEFREGPEREIGR